MIEGGAEILISKEEFGKALAKMRVVKGLSQADVCRELDVSRTSVANWETGTVRPSFQSVVLLADLYGCSLDELAGRSA